MFVPFPLSNEVPIFSIFNQVGIGCLVHRRSADGFRQHITLTYTRISEAFKIACDKMHLGFASPKRLDFSKMTAVKDRNNRYIFQGPPFCVSDYQLENGVLPNIHVNAIY